MKNGRKIGAMLAALATFLLAASLLAPISTTNMYLCHKGLRRG